MKGCTIEITPSDDPALLAAMVKTLRDDVAARCVASPVANQQCVFLTTADLEGIIYHLAPEFYPEHPDPMPKFAYLGEEQGKGQLESALAGPCQTWGGQYLERTVFDKAAVLFRSIVKNHPLIDCNKRLGMTSAFVFLLVNGYLFWMPRTEAIAFAGDIADRSIDKGEIARRLQRGSVKIDKLRLMSATERRRYYEHLAGTWTLILKAVRLISPA